VKSHQETIEKVINSKIKNKFNQHIIKEKLFNPVNNNNIKELLTKYNE
jgi:hypothetical protein